MPRSAPCRRWISFDGAVTAPANLFEQQESNRRRSFWLVTGFVLFFAWVGFGGDLAWYLMTADAGRRGPRHTVPGIGIVATLHRRRDCWYSWRKGPKQVLWATGAWELLEPANEGRQLVNVVEEMAIASGLPRPRIWVVPDADPNAFATGVEPAKPTSRSRRGCSERLNRDELQAVVAHEMAHVRNLDIRLMTLLAAMVGAIALMSDGWADGRVGVPGWRQAAGGAGGSGKGGANPLALVSWCSGSSRCCWRRSSPASWRWPSVGSASTWPMPPARSSPATRGARAARWRSSTPPPLRRRRSSAAPPISALSIPSGVASRQARVHR